MTDRELLMKISDHFRWMVSSRIPMSPAGAEMCAAQIDIHLVGERRKDLQSSNTKDLQASDIERAGDNLAHAHMFSSSPAEHQAWWDARGGECTYCGEDAGHAKTYTNGTSFSDQTARDFYKTPGPYAPYMHKMARAVFKVPEKQRFWRCEHHPSAIDNWYSWHQHTGTDVRYGCQHDCHTSELRWNDNGTCKPPTS